MGTGEEVPGRRKSHVVYRSDGVARAALGAAKKIDPIVPENGRGPIVTKEAGHIRMTDAWSPPCGMFFEPVFPGGTFHSDSVLGARSILDSDDGVEGPAREYRFEEHTTWR